MAVEFIWVKICILLMSFHNVRLTALHMKRNWISWMTNDRQRGVTFSNTDKAASRCLAPFARDVQQSPRPEQHMPNIKWYVNILRATESDDEPISKPCWRNLHKRTALLHCNILFALDEEQEKIWRKTITESKMCGSTPEPGVIRQLIRKA